MEQRAEGGGEEEGGWQKGKVKRVGAVGGQECVNTIKDISSYVLRVLQKKALM